jgi:hypothetical protein
VAIAAPRPPIAMGSSSHRTASVDLHLSVQRDALRTVFLRC